MISKNAEYLLRTRYCRDGEEPEDVYKRVAKRLSNGDLKFEERLYSAMLNGLFLPNSPALFNAGYNDNAFYFACFVVGIEDTIDSIFGSISTMAKIFQHGGGTGFSFSKLRPKGASLSRGGESSGPVSFIKLYDDVVDTVRQGGTRRGAALATLKYNHPDIFEFVRAKVKGGLQNFNLSVGVDDYFMNKVINGGYIDLYHPSVGFVSSIEAKDLFDIICFCAWNNGDPGLLFLDTINKTNPFDEKIEATNPCVSGDTLVLTPYGPKRADQCTEGMEITTKDKFGKFGKGIVDKIEVHENQPLYEVLFEGYEPIKVTLEHQFYTTISGKRTTLSLKNIIKRIQNHKNYGGIETTTLPTGLVYCNFIGYGDVYDLHEPITDSWITNGIISRGCGEVPLLPNMACNLGSINLSKCISGNEFDYDKFSRISELGARTLININKLSGFPLPQVKEMVEKTNAYGLGIMGFADALIKLGIYYDSQECLDFIERVGTIYKEVTDKLDDEFHFYHRIIAPTGSISILANCSSGIEPIYDSIFERNLTIGKIEETREIYKSEYLRTAHQISPEWHIKVQAKWQEFLDGACSKSINMPYSASVDDIKDAYIMAWKMGCKGITIFRDNSLSQQVLTSKTANTQQSKPKCSDSECSL